MALSPADYQLFMARVRGQQVGPDGMPLNMFGAQPLFVSPASPLPVQPTGAPIVAPPPTAQQMAPDFRNQTALAAAQGKTLTPADIAAQSAERVAAARRAGADELKAAVSGATVPEEIDTLLKGREARYAGEESGLEADKNRDMWSALAMAGAKMAQSTSPYFAAALGEGFETGLTGFNKARAEAAEKRARLQDKKEQVVMDRYNALKDARAEARSDLLAGKELTKDELAIANASDDAVREAALFGDRQRLSGAQADLAVFTAKIAPEKWALERAQAQAEIAYKRAAAAHVGDRGGRVGGLKPKDVLDQAAQFMTTGRTYAAAAARSRKPEEKAQLTAQAASMFARAEQLSGAVGLPAAAPMPAAPMPAARAPKGRASPGGPAQFNYDPKRGLIPLF